MAEAQDAPAQRRWRAACPHCGAPVEFASSASASAVCSFCRSTLLREDEVLRRTGTSSELFADYSPLQIGTQGSLQGEPFTVLGRVQLAYEGGSWNEWHAHFDKSGKSAWLSEDNGRFVLSWPLPLSQAPAATELVLGAQQLIDGQGFRVAALTEARLHAAEGELPQPPGLGQPVYVAELRSTRDEVGSLEYLQGESVPRWSLGRAVELGALGLQHTREHASAELGKADQGGAGRSLQCPHCGAAVQPLLSQSLSVTCGQCQSVIDLRGGTGEALRHHQQAVGNAPSLPLGRTGRLSLQRGGTRLPWQVVGHLERCTEDDGEQFFWREYLLFNRTQGFAFLVDSEEGWSLVRVLTGSPEPVGAGVRWQGQQFQLKERYSATTTHVLGEFYWTVRQHERTEVADYVLGEQRLSAERSGQEITWSLGRTLAASEVVAGFGLDPSGEVARALRPDVQAFGSGGVTWRGILILLALLGLVVLLARACTTDRCDDTRRHFGPESAEYRECQARSTSSAYRPSGTGGGGWSGGHK